MIENRDLIVVGGGIAGVTAAQAARAEYPDARVILLSEEPFPFYNRIALNSFITGKKPESQMHFYPLDWLEEQRIEPVYGDGAVSIDRGRKSVALSSGVSLSYDKMILALGAAPNFPPIEGLESPLVQPLWSIANAKTVRKQVEGSEKITIIGGGVLGVETAVDLANLGKSVTLVEAQDRVMPLHLNRGAAVLFQKFLANKGIDVRLGVGISKIESISGGVRLSARSYGSWDCELVLVQTGVQPNTGLAQDAGLECQRGIIVDEYMHTSDPNILACGNCVELNGDLALLWNPARAQGEASGLNAFGNKKLITSEPASIHVKLSEFPIFVCGDPLASSVTDRIVEVRESDALRLLRFDNTGVLLGAICLGNTDGYYEFEKALRLKTPVDVPLIEKQDLGAIKEQLRGEGHDYVFQDGKWVCRMCGFAYEGEYPPSICPVCAVGRDQFLKA